MTMADIDGNEKIDYQEFMNCLEQFTPLRLQESEILTIALSSDIDGTGRIDYQEFMKYF